MRYFALFVLSCLALPLNAMTNVDLYHANIAIDSEQEDGEVLARRQGMEQVVIRASGDTTALKNPVIEKAVAANSRYISQLSYGEIDGAPSVNMRFSDEQIQALLTQAQLPFWSPERRSLLVWLVEEEGLERKVVWDHSPSALANQLKQTATQRGLPITLPLGDFTDITSVEVSDLWGGFVEPISQASSRYSVEAVLVIREQGGNLRWTLYNEAPKAMTSAMSSPLTGVVRSEQGAATLINQLADKFAQQDAVLVSSESTESVDVTFLNVSNAMDFFTLEKRLSALNSVASLEILKIQGDQLSLRVHLLSSRQAFEQQVLQLPRVAKFVDPLEASLPLSGMPLEVPESKTTDAIDVAQPVNDTNVVLADTSAVQPMPTEQQPVLTALVEATQKAPLVFEWLAQ